MLKINVNGEPHVIDEKASVSDLIEQLNISGQRIAVELNMEIVPRSEHGATELNEGDTLEVVHAIGGG